MAATVSTPTRCGRSWLPRFLLAVSLPLAGCGGDGEGVAPGGRVGAPDRVEVTPAQVELLPGEEAALTARVLDADGREVSGAPVAWATGNPAVAEMVGSQGRIRGVALGTTLVTAGVERGAGGRADAVAAVVVRPHPGLSVSPGEPSFFAPSLGPDPDPLVVQLTSAAGVPVAGLQAEVAYPTDGAHGWLTALLGAGSTPTTLTLSAGIQGLDEGEHHATVTVGSSSPQIPSLELPVRVLVGPPAPRLQVDPAEVAFQGNPGAAMLPPRSVAVTNGGSGVLQQLVVSVDHSSGGAEWLTARLDGTATPTTLTLEAAPGNLGKGTYAATVELQAPGAWNSPLLVPVRLTLDAAPPRIVTAADSVEFQGEEGDGVAYPRTIQVTNGGGGNLEGLAARVIHPPGSHSGWLTAGLTTASAPATLTLVAETGLLPAGTHTAQVELAAQGADNSPRIIPVTFVVTPRPPQIVLSAETLAFAVAGAGLPEPPPLQLTLENGGGGTLAGLQTEVVYGGGDPGWLEARLGSPVAPTQVTLELREPASGLEPGIRSARVRFTSPDAPGPPAEVEVTLEVVETRVLTVFRAQGSGNVVSAPEGIFLAAGGLPDSSRVVFPRGTEVTVMVLDSVGWHGPQVITEDGGCPGGPSCMLTLEEDQRVRVAATFMDLARFWFLRGGGQTVTPRPTTSLPQGGFWAQFTGGWTLHNYGFFPINMILPTEAIPDPGWRFRGWEGICQHSAPVCEEQVANHPAPNRLWAIFEPDPAPGQTVEELWPRFGDPVTFQFTAQVGEAPPQPQEVTFNAGGLRSIHPVDRPFQAHSPPPGVSLELSEEGNAARLQASVDHAGLAPGTYQGSVTYASYKAQDVTVVVTVVLTVIP